MADLHALRQLALETLAANRREGTSDWEGRPFNYVCPASDEYPFQWLWDSAFHAIALLHVDPELAKQEIRCLLQAWQPDGFMPHMVLWNPQGEPRPELTYPVARAGDYVTASTQPAVVARALERIYERTGDEGFIRECLPQTALFFDWLWTNRDPDHDSLLSIIQPDESGLDTSPRFDLALGLNGRATIILPEWRAATVRLFERYAPFRGDQHRLLQEDAFQVEDVLVNSIFADGLRSLARLARQIGASGVDAFELDRRAGLVTHALIEKCWDDETGVFWDLWGKEEQPIKVLTVAAIFPLILEDLEPAVAKRLVEDHLLEPAEFWTRYPVPSVSADEPSFDPGSRGQGLWRGPSAVNLNWYLYDGLRRHGYPDVARELAQRTFDLVSRSGMRQLFNPLTGEGLGAQSFGWDALVLDLLASESQG